ncbi:MAG: hypothetical protein QNJ47_01455 [Nostocaceae cyanobacterium]|nr:hypothetical protein [Nostocaceae cyanobacterium]
MYYYPPQSPYLLLVFGLLAAITSGAAFSGTLKLVVQKWQSEGGENSDSRLSMKQLFVPFLGIIGGIGLFLSSGLALFGFSTILAYGTGFVVTLLTSWLVWSQLGSMLAYVESQGMASLDLDSLK